MKKQWAYAISSTLGTPSHKEKVSSINP